MIKKLLLSILLIIQIGCVESKGETKMNSRLMDKPYYTLEIKVVNTPAVITLNGESVFENYDKGQIHIPMPVNNIMTSGKNILEVKLLSYESDHFKIDSNANVSVALKLRNIGRNKKEVVLNRIVYGKGKIDTSKKEGNYSIESNSEQYHIGKLEKQTINNIWLGEKVKGLFLKQNITLETPFPRWKFLDSDNITNKNSYFFSELDYNKLIKREDIKALYALHTTIYKELKKKNIDAIMPLFKERNRESEIAFYKPKGYYDKGIREDLLDMANNKDLELLEFFKGDIVVSEGGKTAKLMGAIVYNSKQGAYNEHVYIKFRKENSKWILTR